MENKEIERLLKQYKTPFYIFDIDILKERICYLKKHLPKRISLCYAMKANPFLVKYLEDLVTKLEVCSPGEYYICKESQIVMKQLVISGVYKTPSVIEQMILDQVKKFTIESLNQLELLNNLSVKYQYDIDVLLRLTSGNQFGMSQSEIENIIQNRENYPFIHINGIQYFSGTQKSSIKRLKKECDFLDSIINHLKNDLHFEIDELEFGTGLPVVYFQDSKTFHEDEFLEEFSKIIDQMQYQGKIIMELGRSIAASCGEYYSRVVDMKVNQNGNYAILDGGMHHMTYYGQMMAMKHPKYHIFPNRTDEDAQMWNLCGSLCTINDLIVKQLPVSNLKVGDVFIFENTGAYSMTEGISLFLSRDLPQVIIKENNDYELVRDCIDTYHLNKANYERREH